MKMFLYYVLCFVDGALVGALTGFDRPVLWVLGMIAVIVFNIVVLGPLFLDDKKGTKDVY